MNKWLTGLLLVSLFELSFSPACRPILRADNANFKPPQQFDRITSEQGLSQNTIHGMIQDHEGFIWFATYDGLNRYDGYNFKIFRHDPRNPQSLSNNRVYCVVEDNDRFLWIGTRAGGINRFDKRSETFISFQNNPTDSLSLSDNDVISIYLDHSNQLWIGTFNGGINLLDRQKLAEGIARFQSFKHHPGNTNSLSNNTVLSIYEDQTDDNILWIGTNDGLNRFDKSAQEFTCYKISSTNKTNINYSNIWSITSHPDRINKLLVGTNGGLFVFDPVEEKFSNNQFKSVYSESLNDKIIYSLLLDRSKNLWIGTNGGLVYQDSKTKEVIYFRHNSSESNSIVNDIIFSLLQDKTGLIWIGTDRGISKFNRNRLKFELYRSDPNNQNSLSHNQIHALYEDHSGAVWIGTFSGGLNKMSTLESEANFIHYIESKKNPYSYQGNFVFSIYEDDQKHLWIGNDAGLNQYHSASNQFTQNKPYPNAPVNMRSNTIFNIYENSQYYKGILWLGGYGALLRFNKLSKNFLYYFIDSDIFKRLKNKSKLEILQFPSSKAHFQFVPQRSDQQIFPGYQDLDQQIKTGLNLNLEYIIRPILIDKGGILWMGSSGLGLYQINFQENSAILFRNDPRDFTSISNNFIMDIYTDRNGQMWIGTYGGLNKFIPQDSSFTYYLEEDGLPNAAVYKILEDNGGYMWLSTNKGISRFDPLQETFENYDVKDGLQDNEFNGGAAHLGYQTGKMYFGGVNGFNVFHPDSLIRNQHEPSLVFTDFKVFNQSVLPVINGSKYQINYLNENESIVLPYNQNSISFEFAALDYSLSDKNQYSYKMDGIDPDWIYAGTRRFVNYSHLSAGNYTFKFRGSNNDGIWNDKGRALKIVITPPFWNTWWFRASIVILIAITLLRFHYSRVRRLEKEQQAQIEFSNRLIESQENERKRIASELHDSLGQNLLILNNELQQVIQMPEYNSKNFESITSIVKESIDEIRDISHNLHPHILDRLGLTKAITSMLSKISQATDLKINSEIENIDHQLPIKFQIHFYRILQEALNNIVKHARADTVSISVKETKNILYTVIEDNGKGFSSDSIKKKSDSPMGIGLADMKERTKLINGIFQISSQSGAGTKININIPLSKGV